MTFGDVRLIGLTSETATKLWLTLGVVVAIVFVRLLLSLIVRRIGRRHAYDRAIFWTNPGQQSLLAYITRFLLPSFLGNSVGGVALVASLAHAQHAPE